MKNENKVSNADIIKKFKNNICNQIESYRKQIINKIRTINERERSYIELIRDLEIQKKQIEDLKKFNKDLGSEIKNQITEIQQLPFVKNIKFTEDGIEIDVGRIEIKYRDNDFYIGDFIIVICPYGVKIINETPIKIKDDYNEKIIVEHPHINDGGDICYGGERALLINKYLANFQLKQLVLMVYLFLKTYTERDCYFKISYWTKAIRKNVTQ
jgi:hypothetical protein